MTSPVVAVIGAGIAGLAAARRIATLCDVVVFEKSRGLGGRLANRRAEGFAFDFGAQYFTARDPRFRAEVETLVAAGLARPWACRFAEVADGRIRERREWTAETAHYVGNGRMSALAAPWAEGLAIRTRTRIVGMAAHEGGWMLTAEEGGLAGPFDAVVLAIPGPQTAALLPRESTLHAAAAGARMEGCYALMLGFEALPDSGFDAALVRGRVLSWLTLTASRPGAAGGPGLVALSRNDWADANMETPAEAVEAAMLAELREIWGDGLAPVFRSLHRWRYANCATVAARPPLVDAAAGLALCGDWTRHGRVEAAFLSGIETGEAVRDTLRGR